MTNDLTSYTALFDFVQHWRHEDLDSFIVQPTGNTELMARVTYEWKGQKLEGISKVYLTRNGYGDGKVSIAPTDILEARLVHGDFDPKWQDYAYDQENHSLRIKGSSKQMGEYKVLIEPVDA